MKRYHELNSLQDEEFLRMTGISKEHFKILLVGVKAEMESEKEKNAMKRRGITGNFSVEDKLLLTLYYLRHYTTFSVLGSVFSISEAYAHEIYHRFSSILVKSFMSLALKRSNQLI